MSVQNALLVYVTLLRSGRPPFKFAQALGYRGAALIASDAIHALESTAKLWQKQQHEPSSKKMKEASNQ